MFLETGVESHGLFMDSILHCCIIQFLFEVWFDAVEAELDDSSRASIHFCFRHAFDRQLHVPGDEQWDTPCTTKVGA